MRSLGWPVLLVPSAARRSGLDLADRRRCYFNAKAITTYMGHASIHTNVYPQVTY